jgi:hypothetical protein
VTKRRRKHKLFERAFAFLTKNQIKIETKPFGPLVARSLLCSRHREGCRL